MTQLMHFDFEDESGATRTLRREEIVTCLLYTSDAADE